MSQVAADKILVTDKILTGMEDEAIQVMNRALEAAYRETEQKLLSRYQNYTADAQPSLLGSQRAVLLLDELKDQLTILNPDQQVFLQERFEGLLEQSSREGIKLSDELMRSIGGESFVRAAAKPNMQAIANAASNAASLVKGHSDQWKKEARYLITQGLASGKGSRKVASELRQRLGVAKGRAETIARTEVVRANNTAAMQNYKANGIEYVMISAVADKRTCPICYARNGNVYRLNEVDLPFHPRCRCVPLPQKPEWVDLGLTDIAWAESQHQDGIDSLAKEGKQPDYGLAPFERMNGAEKPKPVWSPGKPLSELSGQKQAPTSLASLMRMGRNRIAELGENPTTQQFKAIRDELLKGLPEKDAIKLAEKSGITVDAQSAVDSTGITDRLKGGIVSTVAEFHQLTGGNVKQDLGFVRSQPRAWADIERRVINVGGEPSREGIFHEMGHFLEADNPGLAEAARQWRAAKATGDERPLNEIVGVDFYTNENALPGNFVTPYVGKVYANGLTEVVSVGMEYMVSPERMQQLYQADPDHFAFVVGALMDKLPEAA